jgi:hypothetical protein
MLWSILITLTLLSVSVSSIDTFMPTSMPTSLPSSLPTSMPSAFPSSSTSTSTITTEPTPAPTTATPAPIAAATATTNPTFAPTFAPTPEFTLEPTLAPTVYSTIAPTFNDTVYPYPTSAPTSAPTAEEKDKDGQGLLSRTTHLIFLCVSTFMMWFVCKIRCGPDKVSPSQWIWNAMFGPHSVQQPNPRVYNGHNTQPFAIDLNQLALSFQHQDHAL